MSRVLMIALVACSCQGSCRSDEIASNGSGAVTAVSSRRDAAGFGALPAEDPQPGVARDDAGVKPEEPEVPDPGKLIAELGAIPAWQAVIDRAQLIARRKQRGVVYGRIGPVIMVPGPAPEPSDAGVKLDAGMVASPYVWLVDDSDGHGALGIRAKLDGRAAKEGDRVALGGAWDLDAERTWYWKVDAVEPLPPPAPSDVVDPISPVPTHVIGNGDPPRGARRISLAKDGDAVYFQLVGPPPASDGDGWPVADELGNPTFALMNLPGERASYGGQDMRTADERWQLKRGQTYWVRIGKVRKRAPDKPALVNARTAPARVR